MRYVITIAALAGLMTLGMSRPAAAQATTAAEQNATGSLTVAVFDFVAKDKELQDTGALVADLVRMQLSAKDNLRLVTRQDLQKILEEQKLTLTGLTEEAAPRLGRMLGAQVIVVGRLFDLGNRLFITAKVIGVETSRVYGEKVQGGTGDVDKLGEELGEKIRLLVHKGARELVATVRLSGDQIAKLKGSINPKKLPRVYVYVPEQVVGVQATDPAAQTEITYILKKVGIDVVKDRTGSLDRWAKSFLSEGEHSAPPEVSGVDMVLIGEAFSQFASRTGDLISSRARVELQALESREGKVLAIDRQTDVAMDLAEAIAAKSALQQTAANLIYRMLPEAVANWQKLVEEKKE